MGAFTRPDMRDQIDRFRRAYDADARNIKGFRQMGNLLGFPEKHAFGL